LNKDQKQFFEKHDGWEFCSKSWKQINFLKK
jgi:hypothetical protein